MGAFSSVVLTGHPTASPETWQGKRPLSFAVIKARAKGREKMDQPNVCKQCGREYFHHPLGVMTSHSGGDTHGFCSEGCMRAYEAEQKRARLESEKKKGAKVLKKWEKELDKLKNDIARLNEALRGNEPKAIAKARKGRGGGCISKIFLLILLAILGYSIIDAMEKRKNQTGSAPSTTAVESPTNGVDELPPLEMNTNTNAQTSATEGPAVD